MGSKGRVEGVEHIRVTSSNRKKYNEKNYLKLKRYNKVYVIIKVHLRILVYDRNPFTIGFFEKIPILCAW